jgi:hypothetical protein
MNPAEVLVPIAFFFSVAAIIILRGPLGRALAERIAGRASTGDPAGANEALADLTDAVHQLTTDVQALEERLDFTERMLARQQAAPRLKE